ncbi:MAG: serine hydrolase [Candidatus Shapirobacteria bacterium]|nr:serine hydrolase [Candidatus Shapirobacteria bacterium]
MSPLRKSIAISFLSLSIGILIGFGIYYRFIDSKQLGILVETRNKQNYQFINPLLECDNNMASDDLNLNSLKHKIEGFLDNEIEAKHISLASIYYRDLNNGPWFGINERELFSPASLVKVPLMIAYLKASESDPNILNQQLTNTKTYNPKEQNIAPDEVIEDNKSYTIDDLIRRMIVYSDNLAYDLLSENMEDQKIVQVFKDLDVDISQAYTDPNGNILSVKDYASFFRILFNSSYLSKANSEKALHLLSQTTFKNGIVATLPKNIITSHKFGERYYTANQERQLHDCGIVYSPNKPFLICIMTRGSDFNTLSNTIKQISSMVYQKNSK